MIYFAKFVEFCASGREKKGIYLKYKQKNALRNWHPDHGQLTNENILPIDS